MEELVKINKNFQTTNGCQWCRSDTSYLGKRYNVERRIKGGKTYSFSLSKLDRSVEKGIPSKIRSFFKGARCVVLDVGASIEIDHKDGRYNDIDIEDESNYQPMHKTVNDSKRYHCNECKKSGIRYDAKKLGYSVSQIEGTEYYDEKIECQGCYWNDTYKFNQIISEGFKPEE